MVRTSGYKYLKLMQGLLCGKLSAESADMRCAYVIDYANDLYSGGSETEMSRRYWIQMTIYSSTILAPKIDCMHLMYNC